MVIPIIMSGHVRLKLLDIRMYYVFFLYNKLYLGTLN